MVACEFYDNQRAITTERREIRPAAQTPRRRKFVPAQNRRRRFNAIKKLPYNLTESPPFLPSCLHSFVLERVLDDLEAFAGVLEDVPGLARYVLEGLFEALGLVLLVDAKGRDVCGFADEDELDPARFRPIAAG